MENDAKWHYWNHMTEDEYMNAIKETYLKVLKMECWCVFLSGKQESSRCKVFNDFEWVWNVLVFVSVIYTAYIVGCAIYLGGL